MSQPDSKQQSEEQVLIGRVGLITGVGNADGLGSAMARVLAEQGARVVVSATTDERAKAAAIHVAKLANVATDRVLGVAADLMDSKAVWALVEKTQEFGDGVIDIVINNAGTGVIPPRSVESMKDHEEVQSVMESVFGVNVFGPCQIIRAATPYLKKSAAGRIINISSVGAQVPLPTMSFYAASKAALDSMTRTFAVELAPYKITSNSVLPGPFNTVRISDCLSHCGIVICVPTVTVTRTMTLPYHLTPLPNPPYLPPVITIVCMIMLITMSVCPTTFYRS
jgi:3-oxoacyl-[acyl-carrier protein] reductase